MQRARGFFVFEQTNLKYFFVLCAVFISGFAQTVRAEVLKITVGGDTMIGRYMGADLRVHGGPDPFTEISDLLSNADLTLVNVETPITDHVPARIRRGRNLKRHSVIFRMPPSYAALMARHGIDVAILANNHAEDCGLEGARESPVVLDRAGVSHVGVSVDGDPFENKRIKVGDTHVNILAITLYRNAGRPRPGQRIPVAYKPYEELKVWMPRRMAELRKEYPTDVLVASMHWGRQYSDRPSRGQVSLAHDLIEAGADLVLGHHPHVLQPVEAYGGGLIFYSMGNLVFDQLRADARKSAIFQVQLTRDEGGRFRPSGLTMTPIQLRRVARGPRLATAREGKVILGPVQEASRKRFKTRLRLENNKLIWAP